MIKTFDTFIKEHETIPGGKGQNISPEDVDQFELELGIRVELEHDSEGLEISKMDINDPKKIEIAKEIALDHLAERSDYYTYGFSVGLFDEDISDILDKWENDPRALKLKNKINNFSNHVF